MWRIDWGEHERKQEIRRREVMVDWCRARSIEKQLNLRSKVRITGQADWLDV